MPACIQFLSDGIPIFISLDLVWVEQVPYADEKCMAGVENRHVYHHVEIVRHNQLENVNNEYSFDRFFVIVRIS